jgi:hypothetical protein
MGPISVPSMFVGIDAYRTAERSRGPQTRRCTAGNRPETAEQTTARASAKRWSRVKGCVSARLQLKG